MFPNSKVLSYKFNNINFSFKEEGGGINKIISINIILWSSVPGNSFKVIEFCPTFKI